MKSKKLLIGASVSILLALALAGCGEKSVQYYVENEAEALKVSRECDKQGLASLSDKNCVNARDGYFKARRAKRLINEDKERAAVQEMAAEAAAANKKK